MNTHQEWLRQLQEKQAKRQNDGKLTEGERNLLQRLPRKETNSLSLMGAISQVAGNVNEEKEQLDELPLLGPLAMMGARFLAKKAVVGIGKKVIRGVSAFANKAAGGGEEPIQSGYDPTIGDRLELERIMEVVSYKLIEELEDSLGKRLNPEEIEEFVHNNYNKIMAEANNQVTAHAVPGDLRKGVGATAPVVPKGNVGTLKAKASRFNPRRGGSDY
jgi:hypothetical protein